MDMFEWEYVEDTYYPGAIMATEVAGIYYDFLHVEQSSEGWHALFLSYVEGDLVLLEDMLANDELQAQEFAMRFDLGRMRDKVERGEASEEEEGWLAMADAEIGNNPTRSTT